MSSAASSVRWTLAETLALLAENPDARLVAGSTDWGVELNIRHSRTRLSIGIDRLPELRRLDFGDDSIDIGGALTLTEIERGLAGRVPLLAQLTPGWISTGVAESLYSQHLWPVMAQAIKDLQNGTASRIFQLADEYGERDDNGHYGSLLKSFTVIGCDDDNTQISTADIRALQDKWRTQYPLFGPGFATGLLTCQQWPAKRDPYPTGKADGAPPMVVVGTINDPATPYAQTQKLADMLGNSTVLTWQGQGHTAYPQTSCISTAVDNYLINLKVPAAGTTCPA